MTRDETVKLLRIIKGTYSNWKPDNISDVADTWTAVLHDISFDSARMALYAFIRTDTSGFAPTPGQLISKLQMVKNSQELNEQEAWALVAKATKNGFYGAEEEFAKLPPIIQKAVGSPSNIRDISMMDADTVNSVEKSHFVRSYRVQLEREKEMNALSVEMRELIEQTVKALEG